MTVESKQHLVLTQRRSRGLFAEAHFVTATRPPYRILDTLIISARGQHLSLNRQEFDDLIRFLKTNFNLA